MKKVYKDLKATLKVSASNSESISLSGSLSTQDIQTGRLNSILTVQQICLFQELHYLR